MRAPAPAPGTPMIPARRIRVALEGLAVVIILVPLHFFLRRPDGSEWGSAVALLLVLLPAMLALARVEAGSGGIATEALAYLVFGFALGLLLGGVASLARGLLHLITGEALPVRLAVAVGIGAVWSLAMGVAYGAMLFLVWAVRALLLLPAPRADAGRPDRPEPPSPGRAASRVRLAHSRVRPALLAAAICALAGLAVALAGLVALLEGLPPARILLSLGAGLLGLAVLLGAAVLVRERGG
jgi:hypothetical protein